MSSPNAPLIEAPKRSKGPIIAAAVAVLVVALVAVWLVARGGDDSAGAGKKVTIGVVGASDPYWATYKAAAKKQGINLVVKDFTDYTQPNPALSEGELDINQFQHIIYLADYNVKNKDDLEPIGSTAIYPLGLYSKKVDEVADIKSGDTVIVPDDDTNQARALLLLQANGLVQLKGGGTPFSTLADVETGSSKVKVKAVSADLTATSLKDVAAAVINNDFVEKAGLKFADALAKDDPSQKSALPYVNIFAVRKKDVDNATYEKLVKIYQDSAAVQAGVQKVSGGTAKFVVISPATLKATLAKTEAEVKAQQ